MKSIDYRKILEKFLIRAWLHQSMGSLLNHNLLESLMRDLDNPEFYKNATIEQLYDFRGRLFQVDAFCKGLIKQITDSELLFLGEFEDQKMDLTEIGINQKNWICIKKFEDPFSHLEILEGTEIEIEELSYATTSTNMVTAYYIVLKTSSMQKKMIEVFNDGKQATLLNLKIIGENFIPK